MAVLAEETRGADDDVQAVHARLDGELGIAHVAADVLCGVLVWCSGTLVLWLRWRGPPRSVTHVSESWPMGKHVSCRPKVCWWCQVGSAPSGQACRWPRNPAATAQR